MKDRWQVPSQVKPSGREASPPPIPKELSGKSFQGSFEEPAPRRTLRDIKLPCLFSSRK